MAKDRKIEIDTPNLLVKYRWVVIAAAKKGVSGALAMHKAARNTVAVARDGKVVFLKPDDIKATEVS